MTIEEIAELFLVQIYDLAEAAPHPNFFFVINDFIDQLDDADKENVQKAINFLGDRGLVITATMDNFGSISAGITVPGSIFVEQGGETGIIERYRKDPLALRKGHAPADLSTTFPSSAASPMAASAPFPPAPVSSPPLQKNLEERREAPYFAGRAITAILDDVKEILERDGTVPPEIKTDLLSDLATLKIQLSRNVKNKAVIQAILENLVGIPSIAPLVTGLNCIVEAYFR